MGNGKTGKLHELLAVEADLRAIKDKAKSDAVGAFTQNSQVFTGYNKNVVMFDAARKSEGGLEEKVVDFTVNEYLTAAGKHFTRYWDLRLQKETANQNAMSDVQIDGKILFENVPVTFLLNMEEELKQLKRVFEAAPVLASGLNWEKNDLMGADFWKAEQQDLNYRTEKTVQHKVLVEPTQFFPAQIEKWSENKNIGAINVTQLSGCLSNTDKTRRINNINRLINAFKQARQRANCQESAPCKIGDAVFDFINS